MNQQLQMNNISLLECKFNFDADMYLSLYPDLTTKFNKKTAWNHYDLFGKHEKRIFPPITLIKKFDKHTYCKIYPDVLINYTLNTAWLHFLNHGISETRTLYIIGQINTFFKDTLLYIHKKEKPIRFNTIYEKKITILIRTCYRPLLFKKCIESILEQRYSNVNILICYDNKDAEEYINPYINKIKNCSAFYFTIESREKYKFNLYCNELLNRVKDGYCIYLDDDNEFTHHNCLHIINHYLQENKLCVWKYLRGDKIIYPDSPNIIHKGEIDSSSFCFNHTIKQYGQWWDKPCGDYHFFTTVLTNISKIHNNSVNDNLICIPYIITKCIQEKIGNFGNPIIEDQL